MFQRIRVKLGIAKHILCLTACLLGIQGCAYTPERPFSLVSDTILAAINERMQMEGIKEGKAYLDQQGKVEIGGTFEDDDEVDKAFWISRGIVGNAWVSGTNSTYTVRKPLIAKCLGMVMSNKSTPECEAIMSLQTHSQQPSRVSVSSKIKRKFALMVGINHFANLNIIKDGTDTQGTLSYAEADAIAIQNYLNKTAHFDHIYPLLAEQATLANIRNAIGDIKRHAGKDDLIVIYFATHGFPVLPSSAKALGNPKTEGLLNIVTYDTVYSNQDKATPPQGTFNILELSAFIRSVVSQRVVVVLDVCYSGNATSLMFDLPINQAFITQEANYVTSYSAEGMISILGRPRDLLIMEETDQNSDMEGHKNAPLGKVLISSTGQGEAAQECEQFQHGCFTYFLLKELKQHHGKIASAFFDAKQETANQNHKQNPQSVAVPTNNWDFSLTM